MADINKKVKIEIIGDNSNFENSVRKSSVSIKKFAVGASVAVAAVSAAAFKAVDAFRDFEKQFVTVTTLLDKTSFKTKSLTSGIDDLRKGVLNLRASSGESFDNLNKGLFDLISAGVDAENAIDALTVATNLAKAGATSTSVAVDGLTSALNAYGLEANEAESLSEKFFTAQKFGKTTIEELATGFGKVGSIANSFNVSLDEVLASVSAVTLGGINTSEAYTGLAAVFNNIIKPTKDAKDEAERLGISFSSASLRAQGFEGFLNSITSSSGFTDTSLEKLFGSIEASKVILSLAGAQASDFNNVIKELGNESATAKTFQDALGRSTDTLDNKINKLNGSWDRLLVNIGENLKPAAESAVGFMTDITDSINTMLDALPKVGAFFANVASGNIKGTGLLSSPFALPDNTSDESSGGGQSTPVNQSFAPNQSFSGDSATADGSGAVEAGSSSPDDIAKLNQQSPTNLRTEEQQEVYLSVLDEQKTDELKVLEKHNEALIEQDKSLKEVLDKSLAGHLASKVAMEKASSKDVLQVTQDFNNNMASLANSSNKELAAIGKAYSIANAIWNTYQAANLALATLPPPFGQIAAGVAIAAGLANVASIKSTGVQGAAGGTMVGGFDTGRDNQLMAVRSGEMILPPDLAVAAAPTIRDIIRNEDERGVTSASGGGNVSIELVGDAGRLFRQVEKRDSQSGLIS